MVKARDKAWVKAVQMSIESPPRVHEAEPALVRIRRRGRVHLGGRGHDVPVSVEDHATIQVSSSVAEVALKLVHMLLWHCLLLLCCV